MADVRGVLPLVYEDFKPISEWKQVDQFHTLTIHIPGFTKEQMRVRLDDRDSLIVSGERLVFRNRWSRFLEKFEVPANSDKNLISATFDGSVLYITIPKLAAQESKDEQGGRRSMRREVSAMDPDSGSSSLCSGCRLPIFSTPSIPVGDHLFLHEQCARPPVQLHHELHPDHDLVLLDRLRPPTPDPSPTPTCHNCRQICGTMLYQCPHVDCDFQLDLLCALQIKIVHRCHHHSLMAVRLRDSAPLTCNVCDTKHDSPPAAAESAESESATLSYLCNLCGFWVHPDCASLQNAIIHFEHHEHSLFLTYNLPISTDSKCFICDNVPKRSSGVYFCLKCPNYLVHIRCALSRPESFEPVFIRDATVTDLCRLPLADEHTSLIPYIREHAATTTSSDDHYQRNLHPHQLILNKTDGGGAQSSRVCNSCVQFISTPFYSCSHCPDFFLHSCCFHLPTQIQHRAHEEHPLSLSSEAPKSDISARFSCEGCHLWCNGFAYSCESCDSYNMDVGCALINPAITHESHDKTHILFMSRDTHFSSDQKCSRCRLTLSGICFECSICQTFKLHFRCALLPGTVRHVFDDHPLKITASTKKSVVLIDGDDDDEWCEVCEEHLEKGKWFYSCGECNQSFHVDCIPSVDRLAKIKLGSAVCVDGHACPVTLVRQDDAVCGGRRCGFCGEILKFSDDGGLAYECSKCFFCTHYNCAEKCLLNST